MKIRTFIKAVSYSLFLSLFLVGCEKDISVNPISEDIGAIVEEPVVAMTPAAFDKDWGLKNYVVEEPNTEFVSETAYAKFSIEEGGYVFSKKANPEDYPTLGMKTSKWGWAVNLSEGEYVVPLFAGAGKNDIEKGTFVGRLKVIVSPTEIYVKYLMIDNNFITEVHTYISDVAPTTAAPGQYGYTQVFDPTIQIHKNIFDFEDINNDGKVWLIAHAVVNIH